MQVSVNLPVSPLPFPYHQLTAYRSLLFNGIREIIFFSLKSCKDAGYVGIMAAQEGEFPPLDAHLRQHCFQKRMGYIDSN